MDFILGIFCSTTNPPKQIPCQIFILYGTWNEVWLYQCWLYLALVWLGFKCLCIHSFGSLSCHQLHAYLLNTMQCMMHIQEISQVTLISCDKKFNRCIVVMECSLYCIWNVISLLYYHARMVWRQMPSCWTAVCLTWCLIETSNFGKGRLPMIYNPNKQHILSINPVYTETASSKRNVTILGG